jgi:hypothetical protein
MISGLGGCLNFPYSGAWFCVGANDSGRSPVLMASLDRLQGPRLLIDDTLVHWPKVQLRLARSLHKVCAGPDSAKPFWRRVLAGHR